jgi:hypothetical protein
MAIIDPFGRVSRSKAIALASAALGVPPMDEVREKPSLPDDLPVSTTREMFGWPADVSEFIERCRSSYRNDAQAVLGSLGAIAEAVHTLSSMTDSITRRSLPAGELTRWRAELAIDEADSTARLMVSVRRRMASVLEDLGDYFNNRDCVSGPQQALTAPVFSLMHLREAGVDTEDFAIDDAERVDAALRKACEAARGLAAADLESRDAETDGGGA